MKEMMLDSRNYSLLADLYNYLRGAFLKLDTFIDYMDVVNQLLHRYENTSVYDKDPKFMKSAGTMIEDIQKCVDDIKGDVRMLVREGDLENLVEEMDDFMDVLESQIEEV